MHWPCAFEYVGLDIDPLIPQDDKVPIFITGNFG